MDKIILRDDELPIGVYPASDPYYLECMQNEAQKAFLLWVSAAI